MSLGPGSEEHLTPRARKLLASSQVVVGYKMYVDLVRPLLSGQEVIATGMMGELQRCQLAIDRALAGARVALVSSGDVGVYGMAGLALEICQERGIRLGPLSGGPEVDLPLEVVPGVPALAAAAALLGAPLMHDFASVSLSDLMTPWEVIKKRMEAAAAADFVMVIYNPKSKKRDWQLGKVREILLHYRRPETPVGIVSRAMREGQDVRVTSLGEMLQHPVDMQTIIIIGNSQTYEAGGYMITPRGYLDKYTLGEEKSRGDNYSIDMKYRPLMILGAGSDVGKSILVAALCRIFRQEGIRVAPFKAQNMALNSFITPEGGEMGRAQVVQAQAAGLTPQVDMNPILLKPCSDVGSQVIVHGRVYGNLAAREYYEHKPRLVRKVMESYRRLAAAYDLIVLEGAGSAVELNLKQNDLVNFSMASRAGAAVLLVADIDRGGVFAVDYRHLSLADPGRTAAARRGLSSINSGEISLCLTRVCRSSKRAPKNGSWGWCLI